jgi:prepilin-type N-terminal cleavage/methylation domain-containing protein
MKYRSPTRGFSLIELIVAMGLFSLVMLVATSAYYTLIGLDRRARATNDVVNNVSFAVDSMSRGMRTGTNYQCYDGSPDADGNSTNGNCTCAAYFDTNLSKYVTYHLMGSQGNHSIGRTVGAGGPLSCNDAQATSITAPSINISTLAFYIQGAGASDDYQPHIIYTVKGSMPADNKGNTTTFTIQGNATQRRIDL